MWEYSQGGTISGVTNYANIGGVYESNAIRSDYAITFNPLGFFFSVRDVAGAGMQEQAFYNVKDNTGFYYFVAARAQNVTVSGDYYAFGLAS